MKKLLTLFLLVCITNNLFCQSNEVQTFKQNNGLFKLDSTQLLEHVKILASDDFEGRRTGTNGAIKAKDYIISELKNLKVQPLSESFEQKFSFSSRKSDYDGINILGLIEGSDYSDEYIVLSAHYDHEGIKNGVVYNGADDDASGVSALLAFADYFKKSPPNHSIILAFFDAEELGLRGSRYYVDNTVVPIDNIKLNINLDMVSRSDRRELYITGAKDNKDVIQLINSKPKSEQFKFIMGHDGTDGKQNWTYSSDHGSFYRKGIPFLYFGVEDHKDYHRPTDDFENIHPEFYKNAVENMLILLKEIDALVF